jgi:hypothetical protein
MHWGIKVKKIRNEMCKESADVHLKLLRSTKLKFIGVILIEYCGVAGAMYGGGKGRRFIFYN